LVNGKISVTKAVVNGQPKNRTKTNQDREVNLCPRALQVLHAQLSLRAQMAAAGMINHNRMFFTAVGEPFVNTSLPYRRWTEVLKCSRRFLFGIASRTTAATRSSAGDS
jgi:hypothetical protein